MRECLHSVDISSSIGMRYLDYVFVTNRVSYQRIYIRGPVSREKAGPLHPGSPIPDPREDFVLSSHCRAVLSTYAF